MSKECGDCALCCKLFAIDDAELQKPLNVWCKHCKPGTRSGACSIYERRPTTCVDYECMWKQSDVLGPELKPNQCHIIFDVNADSTLVVARVDPAYPGATEGKAARALMETMARNKIPTYVICGDKRRIFGHEGNPALLRVIEESIRGVNEDSNGPPDRR